MNDSIDVFSLHVHPDAEAFPMLSEDDLSELAGDIKANGLLQPIAVGLVNDEWVVVDGRNRREACRLAGITPHVEYLNGVDLKSYIVASNIHRRHMTKGQQAMAVAKIYPDAEKGGRGKKSLETSGFSRQRLGQARTVLAAAPDLVDGVMDGTVHLDAAYKQAMERKKAKEWRNDGLRKLESVRADLADRVRDGTLTLEEARAIYESDDREAKSTRDSVFMGLRDLMNCARSFHEGTIWRELPQWLEVEEYRDEMKRYFKGGLREFLGELDVAESGIKSIRDVTSSIRGVK